MPVQFKQYEFVNNTGLTLDVTLEAPIGMRVNGTSLPSGNTWRINPRVVAESSRTIVDVPSHGREHHDVRAMGTPVMATIESQSVRFTIGSARIRFIAATHEDPDDHRDDDSGDTVVKSGSK